MFPRTTVKDQTTADGPDKTMEIMSLGSHLD